MCEFLYEKIIIKKVIRKDFLIVKSKRLFDLEISTTWETGRTVYTIYSKKDNLYFLVYFQYKKVKDYGNRDNLSKFREKFLISYNKKKKEIDELESKVKYIEKYVFKDFFIFYDNVYCKEYILFFKKKEDLIKGKFLFMKNEYNEYLENNKDHIILLVDSKNKKDFESQLDKKYCTSLDKSSREKEKFINPLKIAEWSMENYFFRMSYFDNKNISKNLIKTKLDFLDLEYYKNKCVKENKFILSPGKKIIEIIEKEFNEKYDFGLDKIPSKRYMYFNNGNFICEIYYSEYDENNRLIVRYIKYDLIKEQFLIINNFEKCLKTSKDIRLKK